MYNKAYGLSERRRRRKKIVEYDFEVGKKLSCFHAKAKFEVIKLLHMTRTFTAFPSTPPTLRER